MEGLYEWNSILSNLTSKKGSFHRRLPKACQVTLTPPNAQGLVKITLLIAVSTQRSVTMVWPSACITRGPVNVPLVTLTHCHGTVRIVFAMSPHCSSVCKVVFVKQTFAQGIG